MFAIYNLWYKKIVWAFDSIYGICPQTWGMLPSLSKYDVQMAKKWFV